MIAIVDYDIGNLAAVSNMLARVGVPSVITSDAGEIAAASGIILPGNGHFDSCMRGLNASGLRPVLERRVMQDRVPLLGICVGAQMLGLRSEEGTEPGLGWLQMTVDRFPKMDGLRVPHMGWNHVTQARNGHPLLTNLPEDARFYFVHSYYLNPANSLDRMLECHYGVDFAAGVARDNVMGVQFHPEKSHRFGKILLGNFAELVI